MRLIRVTAAALAVLALTATLASAGREDTPPPPAEPGLERAREASGQDVPVRAKEVDGGLDEEEILEPDVEPDVELGVEPEVVPAADGGEHCIDPDDAGAEALVDGEEPNHGATVCGAARFGDWEAAGCDNHGQYIRTFANKNLDGEPGECEPAAADATVETVEAAGATSGGGNGNGRGNGHADGNGNGHGRGQGRP